MPAVAYKRLRDLLASDPTSISKSLSDTARGAWTKVINTNPTDLDALGDSIDQATRTTGIPQLALLPMALKSPKLLKLLSSKLGKNLAKEIEVGRFQREMDLGASHPGRGGWFFNLLEDVSRNPYKAMGEQVSYEGGPQMISSTIQPKNPFLVKHGFSALGDSLNPLLGKGRWRQEAKKLPNNVIRQIISHEGSIDANQVLKDRLAAEILKRYGYDSVISATTEGIGEIVKLRNTKGTHLR